MIKEGKQPPTCAGLLESFCRMQRRTDDPYDTSGNIVVVVR